MAVTTGSTSVAKGELYPLAVQVLPASSDYSDFTINSETTHVEIQNTQGIDQQVHGDLSIDSDNKTVMFSWDTSKYDIGSYSIIFWVSVTYNNTTFLIRSNPISKIIRRISVI